MKYFTWQTPNKWITNEIDWTRAYRGVHNGATVGVSTACTRAWITALPVAASELSWALVVGPTFGAARWRFRHHRWATRTMRHGAISTTHAIGSAWVRRTGICY